MVLNWIVVCVCVHAELGICSHMSLTFLTWIDIITDGQFEKERSIFLVCFQGIHVLASRASLLFAL